MSHTEVSVETDKGTYTAHGLVITTGGWTAKIYRKSWDQTPLNCEIWFCKLDTRHENVNIEVLLGRSVGRSMYCRSEISVGRSNRSVGLIGLIGRSVGLIIIIGRS